jgi:tetratricopeptide (TPR) repeat protein
MGIKALSVTLSVLVALSWSTEPFAQQKITCPDKTQRFTIDLKQVQIQYNASSFAGTLASLGALSAHLSIEQKVLQQASAATQQWNEFLKGLVAGYNSCAITNQQYADSLKRIYPRLKQDAAGLDEIRKAISDDRKADENRLKSLLESYFANLRQFAVTSGNEIVIDRIAAIVEKNTDLVLKRIDELERNLKQAPVATPAEVKKELIAFNETLLVQVKKEVSAIKGKLLAKAEEAQAAYDKGYDLYQRYRFSEAIASFKEAIDNIPLPEFYLALGNAYLGLPDLVQSVKIYTEGLEKTISSKDQKTEASFSNQLGRTLLAKGDLDGALRYSQRALAIDETVSGPEHPDVARDTKNIGMILLTKGDLDGALRYAQRALAINEKIYGPEHPDVARDANNIGMIFQDKGDLDGALRYTQRALAIDEKVYGPDHPNVAVGANNIGTILKDKGDLDRALRYFQRALSIDEKVYGTEHPNVAVSVNNVGGILKAKGDLDGALRYTQRALSIDEKVYGPDHPDVALDASNIGGILFIQGDLDGASRYTERALKILENTYGVDNPQTKIVAGNLRQINDQREVQRGSKN